MRSPALLCAFLVAVALPSCAAATAPPSASGIPGVATLTDGPAPREASVYVEVKDAKTDVAVRTRVTSSQDVAVTGSSWVCRYKLARDFRPDSPPPGGPTSLNIHTLECEAAGFGTFTFLSCPPSSADVSKEAAAQHVARLQRTLNLTETKSAKRYLLTLSCEP